MFCVRAFFLILTTGHFKDPAGGPEHSQTQHRAVGVDLIFGKSSSDPHADEDCGRALEADEDRPQSQEGFLFYLHSYRRVHF